MSEYIKKSVLLHWLSLYPHVDIPLKMLTYYIDKMQGVGEDAISAEYEGYKKTAEKEMELCRELTVAAAGIERQAKEFAERVIRVYGCRIDIDGQRAYISGGSLVLKEAFAIARWDDPHLCPECECEEDGCHEWATGGMTTPDGYKWLCSRHREVYQAREEAERERKED